MHLLNDILLPFVFYLRHRTTVTGCHDMQQYEHCGNFYYYYYAINAILISYRPKWHHQSEFVTENVEIH